MKRDNLPVPNIGSSRAARATPEQTAAWLRGFLQHEFGIAAERLNAEADVYQDLDLDSIDAAEIVLKFNDAFDRDVDARDFRGVRTLAQAIELLHR